MVLTLKLDANFLPISVFDAALAKESAGVFISVDFYTFFLKINSMESSIGADRVCTLTLDININSIDKSIFIPYEDSFGFITQRYYDLDCVRVHKGPKCSLRILGETKSFYIYSVREFYHYYVQRIKDKFFEELFSKTWSFKFVNKDAEVIYDVISYHFIDFNVNCQDPSLDLNLHEFAQADFQMLYSEPVIRPGKFLRVWLKDKNWFELQARKKRKGISIGKPKSRIKKHRYYFKGYETGDPDVITRAGALKLGPNDKRKFGEHDYGD